MIERLIAADELEAWALVHNDEVSGRAA